MTNTTKLKQPKIAFLGRGRYKYEIMEDWDYQLSLPCYWDGDSELECLVDTDYYRINGSVLTLKKGYKWDGATCAPDLETVITASAVHDCLLQLREEVELLNVDIDRDIIDFEFYYKCREDGTSFPVAVVYFLGAWLGGGVLDTIRKVGKYLFG